MHATTDPAAPTEDAPRGGWRDVAAATFQHHLRGPWFVALAAVALLGPALMLAFQAAFGGSFTSGSTLARVVVPRLADPPQAALPLLLLLLVVSGYRGAYLRDATAARERVVGFFAGTWAAAVAALVPWALLAFLLAAWLASPWSALLGTLAHLLALALHAGAWIALGLLLAVAFRREESRWVAAGVAYVTLTVLLASMASIVVYSLAVSSSTEQAPAWGLLVDATEPSRLADLLVESLGASDDSLRRFGPDAPFFYNPLGLLAAFGLWLAVPLALAVRAQSRASDPLAPIEPL